MLAAAAPISSVELLGGTRPMRWTQAAETLEIEVPDALPNPIAGIFTIGVRR